MMGERPKAAFEDESLIVVEVDAGEAKCIVTRGEHEGKPIYQVWMNGMLAHRNCEAEDVMRALGNYLHSISFRALKAERKP